MTVTAPDMLFDLADLPVVGLPYAPTARLLLPADASQEEWLAVRRTGIGGSDVAGILGMDKHRGPRRVYEEKHGYAVRDNRHMRFGRRMEPVIAAEFEDETGLTTAMPTGTLAHLEHGWARANVDRFVLDEAGNVVAPLECKNRGEWAGREWEEGDEAPEATALQAHWYTAVGGWSHSYAAAVVGGNRLVVFRQERDEELVEELFRYCGEWYQRHVVEGFPPEVDGLKSTTDLLARLWECKPEEVAQVDLTVAKDLRAQRAALKAQIKELEEEVRVVENRMRDLTGESGVAMVGQAKAWSWTPGNFAPKRFREEEPELAAEFTHVVEDIDLDRLKAERPDVYTRFRARTLRVPAKGI